MKLYLWYIDVNYGFMNYKFVKNFVHTDCITQKKHDKTIKRSEKCN